MKTLSNTLKASMLAACLATPVLVAGAGNANAAGKAFCHGYANTAVFQHRLNKQRGCGYMGFRWHGWKKGHYAWCRGVPAWKAGSERGKRWRLLNVCN